MKGVTSPLARSLPNNAVSIHTPNEGSDIMGSNNYLLIERFQSTLPMKGVTTLLMVKRESSMFQSTLPMKGVTRRIGSGMGIGRFQSTLPMKGVTPQ